MQDNRFSISIKLMLFLIIVSIFIPITFIYSEYFNNFIEKNIFREKENKILTTLTLSSKIFSDDNFELHINKNDSNYLKNKIEELKTQLPNIKNIFILYKEENKISNLLDKNYDTAKISDIYLNQGFIKPTISKIIYSDKSSKWLLAFAPIKEVKNKEFILLMQIYISDFENIYFSQIFKDILVLSIILVYLIVYIIVLLVFKPLKDLNKIINDINAGNLDFKIKSYWFYSEVSELFISLSTVSQTMKKYIEKYQNIQKKLDENNKMIENANKQNKNKNYQLNHLITVLNKINLFMEKLINIRNINDFANNIIKDIINIFDAEKALLAEYIPEKNVFKILSYSNTNIIKNTGEYKFNKENIILNLLETKNTINIYEKSSIFNEEFDNAIISPILINNEIQAFILIMNKANNEDYFHEEDETTMKSLSKLLSSLWNSIHLFELASIDNTTKLYLRRYLERNLEEEISKATKNDLDLSLIMIDIDNLKIINEKYGREFGDALIKKVIDKIKNLIKPEYIASKYSGQIISILLPNTSFDISLELAENIKNEIENISFEDKDLKVTISIGISSYPEKTKSPNLLLKSCEEFLYLAKTKGRNRIEYHQS